MTTTVMIIIFILAKIFEHNLQKRIVDKSVLLQSASQSRKEEMLKPPPPHKNKQSKAKKNKKTQFFFYFYLKDLYAFQLNSDSFFLVTYTGVFHVQFFSCHFSGLQLEKGHQHQHHLDIFLLKFFPPSYRYFYFPLIFRVFSLVYFLFIFLTHFIYTFIFFTQVSCFLSFLFYRILIDVPLSFFTRLILPPFFFNLYFHFSKYFLFLFLPLRFIIFCV